MDPTWEINEFNFNPDLGRAYEGLFTLGSGLLHLRGSLEEHLFEAPQNLEFTRYPTNTTVEKFVEQKAKWGTYHPGMRGNHPLLNRGIVNLPYFLDLTPYMISNGVEEKLDVERSQIREYQRTLDLKKALLKRRLVWQTQQGACLEVKFERFVSAAHMGLCMQRMEIAICDSQTTDEEGVNLRIQAGIDGDVRTSGYDIFTHLEYQESGKDGICCNVATNVGDTAQIQTWLLAPGCIWSYSAGDRKARLETRVNLKKETPFILEKRTLVTSSFDRMDAQREGNLPMQPYSQIFEEHARVWEIRWGQSDVIIEGDPISQLAIRASIYHLLRSHTDDDRLAIDPKGYAGDAYRGCYFWDTEMYLLPFFIYTDPERARSLLAYRIHSLPGAMINAQNTGYRGARYAWEADVDGTETCPNWQYRDHEVHVTADVVYAMAHYAAANQDEVFLYGAAKDVILETARYWMDRIDWRKGVPGLLGVMGPDEYTPISSNNSYTNRLAAFNLSLAARLGDSAGVPRIELDEISRTASNLPVLRSEDGQLVLQCEEFERLAEPAFKRFWLDRSRPYAAQVAQEWLYRSKCLKQADVLMLMMLFPNEFSGEEVRTAWDTYLPYTTHDSSLSAGVHAIVACRLGFDQDAWDFWEKSSLNDLDFEHGGAAEGVHIAGAGINWQMVVFGFAGVSTALNADILSLKPRLPVQWKRLAFPILWKQQQATIEIRAGFGEGGKAQETTKITNHSDRELIVKVNSVTKTISPGETSTFLSPTMPDQKLG